MKIAISLPDDLFEEVEACSQRLNLSRSRFFVRAARELLARQIAGNATEAWDRAIAADGQPGRDPAARAFRERTRAVVRASSPKRRR